MIIGGRKVFFLKHILEIESKVFQIEQIQLNRYCNTFWKIKVNVFHLRSKLIPTNILVNRTPLWVLEKYWYLTRDQFNLSSFVLKIFTIFQIIRAIQVLRIHLLELEKVQELCKEIKRDQKKLGMKSVSVSSMTPF